MKVSEVYRTDYVAAGDLDRKDVTLTIKAIHEPNKLKREDGKLIDKPVAEFVETPKKLVIGKTNARLIRMTHGNVMDSWVGRKITLYPTTTEMAKAAAEQAGCMILSERGKMVTVPCIRVRVSADAMGGMS